MIWFYALTNSTRIYFPNGWSLAVFYLVLPFKILCPLPRSVIDLVCFNLLPSSAFNGPQIVITSDTFFALSRPSAGRQHLWMKWCGTSCVHVCPTLLHIIQATVKILLNSKIGDVWSWLTPSYPFLKRNHTNPLVAGRIPYYFHIFTLQILTLTRIAWFANSSNRHSTILTTIGKGGTVLTHSMHCLWWCSTVDDVLFIPAVLLL